MARILWITPKGNQEAKQISRSFSKEHDIQVVESPSTQDISAADLVVAYEFDEKYDPNKTILFSDGLTIYDNVCAIASSNPEAYHLCCQKSAGHVFYATDEKHYRFMFDSVLGRLYGRSNVPFVNKHEVYLASADCIDNVLYAVYTATIAKKKNFVDTYCMVCGGFSGINTLLGVVPQRIVFYDTNLWALEYSKMLLEIINVSCDHRDFISKIFARRVTQELTYDNQELFLQQDIDQQILENTLEQLSPKAQNIFTTFLVHKNSDNCRRLLPCWPNDRFIPVSSGGTTLFGTDIPNTNTFSYGYGWLASAESFNCVKNILSCVTKVFIPWDLLNMPISLVIEPSKDNLVYISNIGCFLGESLSYKLNVEKKEWFQKQGTVTFISEKEAFCPREDPHERAWLAIKPYIKGEKIVEVTTKTPWGFHEIKRNNVTNQEYLSKQYHADTTILHTLMGEGLDEKIFLEVAQKASKISSRLIILEHNSTSTDWRQDTTKGFITKNTIDVLLISTRAKLAHQQFIRGFTDHQRNILIVLLFD